MSLLRDNQNVKTGLSFLFTLLLCTQSFATPWNSWTAKAELPHCDDIEANEATTEASCLQNKPNSTKEATQHPNTPAQHSHESENELEEKGEKELEDDKEEMDKNSRSFALSVTLIKASFNEAIKKYTVGPALAVPTPPPNVNTI
jgi:hypothetical protein